MADVGGTALVVCYGFNTSPHAMAIFVFKMPLNVLLVPALSFFNALLQLSPDSPVEQHLIPLAKRCCPARSL